MDLSSAVPAQTVAWVPAAIDNGARQLRLPSQVINVHLASSRHNVGLIWCNAGIATSAGDAQLLMGKGWEESAHAWIASLGERGDWGREHVLDPVMLGRIVGRRFERALDVGCGEGRFCRMLREAGIAPIGIDPTLALIEEARRRDPVGDYRLGRAEALPFESASFDLVVSYLSLIDIADLHTAIREMARVLKPRGVLLIANLTSFVTACGAQGWVRDAEGRRVHYPLDRYLDEFPNWVEWAGVRVENWHRPLSVYMRAFLDNDLQLSFFSEPEPVSGEPSRREAYRRAPWFLVMEWRQPL